MSAYSDAVLADSPAGYWRLGDSGSTCTDSSGNSHSGTYTAGFSLSQAGLLTGDPDSSVSFDGTTGYVDFAVSGINITSGDWTLEGWSYPTAFGASHRGILGAEPGCYAMTIKNGVHLVTNVNVADAAGATSPPLLNSVNYLVATFVDSSDLLSYYLNGQPNGTTTFTTTTTAGKTVNAIGSRDRTTDFFSGRLDECAVYTSAVSAARILAHYNAGVQSGLLLPQWPRVRFNG